MYLRALPWPPVAFTESQRVLRGHPLHACDSPPQALEGVLVFLQRQPQCQGIPIFLSMAAVGSDLYWQLIENFVYTAVKFKYSDCSLVICVSDPRCVALCKDNLFPCFDYTSPPSLIQTKRVVSVMEQISYIKLFETPKALALGVNVFMLDLDVGFLSDPLPVKTPERTPQPG